MADPTETKDRAAPHAAIVWLVRHGESVSNAGGRCATVQSIPLTEVGHAQARRVAQWVPSPPALIACSPYLRASQTAEPTIERFGRRARTEQWPVHEFTHLSPERCRDTSTAERFPWVERYWAECDPVSVDGDGAESFLELIDRVDATIQRLSALTRFPVAVFTHAMFIRAMLWRLNGG